MGNVRYIVRLSAYYGNPSGKNGGYSATLATETQIWHRETAPMAGKKVICPG